MPNLIVVAGPNGAGKSEYTKTQHSIIATFGISSFDYDIEFAKIYNRFQNIMTPEIEENIELQTKELFEELARNALQENKNFSFQTNFDKLYTDKWRRLFKKAGFKTHLYFLYLRDTKLCEDRVAKRVAQGGHNVPKDQIEKRYRQGLINLDKKALAYDCVKIIDTSAEQNKLLFELDGGVLKHVESDFLGIIKDNNLRTIGKHLKQQLL